MSSVLHVTVLATLDRRHLAPDAVSLKSDLSLYFQLIN